MPPAFRREAFSLSGGRFRPKSAWYRCATRRAIDMSRCEPKRTAVVSKSGQFVVSKSGRAIKSGLLLSRLVAQSRADPLGVLHRRIGFCGDATRAPTGGL